MKVFLDGQIMESMWKDSSTNIQFFNYLSVVSRRHLCSPAEAIRRINQYGAEGKPFFFVFDYEVSSPVICPLEDWATNSLCFDFKGRKGSSFAPIARGHCAVDQTTIPELEWHVFPPSRSAYQKSFDIVQHHLHRGDSFLTNLTMEVPLKTNLTLEQLYIAAQAPFKLLWPGMFVCFSPEPFIEIAEGKIRTFPMKGTIDAHVANAEQTLLEDEKEKAEHATVVDLLRNDLSQVAKEVHVKRYRYVERVQTHRGELLQTSSEIVGTLPEDYLQHLGTILFKLLPAGSITGAPKEATKASIAEAEYNPRGYYTGVMGCFDGKQLQSAVMIRFLLQYNDGRKVFKAGGGITTRSDAESEYKELLDKVYAPI